MKRVIEFEDKDWDEAFNDATARLESQREYIAKLEFQLKESRELRDAEADRYLNEVSLAGHRHRQVVAILVGIAAMLGFSLIVLAEAMVWP